MELCGIGMRCAALHAGALKSGNQHGNEFPCSSMQTRSKPMEYFNPAHDDASSTLLHVET
eukprot:352861-Chlamydomonas_euryale.AAC.15